MITTSVFTIRKGNCKTGRANESTRHWFERHWPDERPIRYQK